MLQSWIWCLLLSLLCPGIVSPVRADAVDTIVVQDDTPGISYSGPWTDDSDPKAYGNHATWTEAYGASASFQFIGTSITVYATKRPIGQYLTNVSFSIDGGTPTLWTSTDNVPVISYRERVFRLDNLPPATHSITMTNYGKNFWFDYARYTPVPAPPNPSSTSTTQTTAANTQEPTPPPQSITATGVSSATGAPAGATTTSTTKHTSVIIGVVVGVLGVVVLFLAALYWLCKRRRAQRREKQAKPFLPAANSPDFPLSSSTKERPPTVSPLQYSGGVGMIHLRPQVAASNPSVYDQHSLYTSPRAATPPPRSHTSGSGSETATETRTETERRADTDATLFSSKLRSDEASLRGTSHTDPFHGHMYVDTHRRLSSSQGSATSPTTTSAGHTAPSASRRLRESLDGGVRLAGGPLLEQNEHMLYAPGEYDEMLMANVLSLPPSYAQIHSPSSFGGR